MIGKKRVIRLERREKRGERGTRREDEKKEG